MFYSNLSLTTNFSFVGTLENFLDFEKELLELEKQKTSSPAEHYCKHLTYNTALKSEISKLSFDIEEKKTQGRPTGTYIR